MANDKIVLAKLDVDTRALVESAAQTKKEIAQLIEQQQKLAEKGKETSEQFVVNAAELKKLEAAYKTQQAAIVAQINEEGKLVSQKKAIKQAVAELNQTENDYISNNRELIALKKELNTTDDDYEKKLAGINQKLQENNTWLQENGSAHAKLITTYNDFKQQVAESFDSINIFNGGLGGLISRAQEAGGVGPLLKNAFDGITGGIGGMTKAAWGFVSNPIGAILTVLVLVVQGLMAVFKDFTPIMDKVEQITAAVGAVFESVKNSVIGLITGATSLSDFFSSFGSSMADAATEAVNLTKAQQKLQDEMDKQEVANEKAKTQIDALIARSKDMSLTEKERADALKEARKIENDNFKERKRQGDEAYAQALKAIENGANLTAAEKKRLAEEGYAYAKQLLNVKSIKQEELDALKSAEKQKEQLTREGISLAQKLRDEEATVKKQAYDAEQKLLDEAERKEEERARKRAKRLDDYVTQLKLLLDLYIQEQGIKAKTMAEELAVAENIAKKEKDIAQAEFNASEKSANDRLSLQWALNAATEKNLKAKSDIISRHSQAEIDLYKQEHQTLLKNGTDLTKHLISEEAKRLETIKNMSLEKLAEEKNVNSAIVAEKRKNNQELTVEEKEFLKGKLALEQEYNTKVDENNEAFKAQVKAREVTQAEADKQIKIAKAATDYDAQLIEEDAKYQADMERLTVQLQNKDITEEQYKALSLAREKEHKEKTEEINLAKETFIRDQYAKTFGTIKGILGEKTVAGKAAAIAEATINTYNGATQVLASPSVIPEPMGSIQKAVSAAAIVATGLATVKKITSTKTPKAEKGALFSIGGNRHSEGGTMFTGEDGTRFEAEKGEIIGVMNRNAARHFMAFNNTFTAGGSVTGGNYFESGGIVSREIAPAGLNLEELAAITVNAVKSLPAPVVAVQDIITQGNSYIQVRESANF